MANLSSAIDSVFWDHNLSSPQTLEGTARSVPGEPFPVDGARASRSHRIQQLSLLREGFPLGVIPAFAPSSDKRLGSFSLNSLLLSPSSSNWWAGLVGQFKPKKLFADIKTSISKAEEWDLQLFKDTTKHIVDKSLYSVGLWTQIALGSSSSLLLSAERLGDKNGIRKKLMFVHPLEKHDLTVEAAWPDLFLDHKGRFWDVPESLNFDFSSLAPETTGLQYRFGVHKSKGDPQQVNAAETSGDDAPASLFPGLCAKAAVSYKANRDLWRPKEKDDNTEEKKKKKKRMAANEEAVKYVWEGAIPLQIHLHKSEVASHPAPPPALVLAPRIGYLPLLVSLIKPYFKDSLPPGEDSIWFDYKGVPLKWYIPTGVLFDLLCAEPERPWNLTIHFRGYPSNVLIPCEGEDSAKWNFVNSLKEAAYIINGNCKNVMNMSQSDQEDLWTSVMNGDLDAYTRLLPKLKMGNIEDKFSRKADLSSPKSRQGGTEIDVTEQVVKTARIPVRLYVRSVNKDFENLEDVPEIDTWDEISYLNRPVEFLREKGKCYFTLRDAIESLLPEYSGDRAQTSGEEEADGSQETRGEIKLVRIQGIELKLEIPFSWVVNNLMNPEFYLHISVLVIGPQR